MYHVNQIGYRREDKGKKHAHSCRGVAARKGSHETGAHEKTRTGKQKQREKIIDNPVESENLEQGNPVQTLNGPFGSRGIFPERLWKWTPEREAEYPPIITLKTDVSHQYGQSQAAQHQCSSCKPAGPHKGSKTIEARLHS